MSALAAFLLAGGIETCTPPAIIPWRPGPRDTVFIELDRGSKGCVFIAGERIPGPPYVISAAFAARPDSAYLGVAINRMVPPNLVAKRETPFMTPERARRFAFVHGKLDGMQESAHYRPLADVVRTIAADPRVASVAVDSTTALFPESITIRWKDDLAWRADVSMPYFVRIPGDPKFVHLWGMIGAMEAIRTGRSFEYESVVSTRANGRSCQDMPAKP